MNQYVTGAMIKRLREKRNMTQSQLAEKLNVSDKTVSKWETGNGYPDITLVEPIAKSLGISVVELMSGNDVTNANRSFNMLRTKLYVCPVCGNVIQAAGEAVISCHGLMLPPLEAEPADDEHGVSIEPVEDEYYVTVDHPMSREHYISFIAALSDDKTEIVKLYPEWSAGARFKRGRASMLYFCCNRHGLFKIKL